MSNNDIFQQIATLSKSELLKQLKINFSIDQIKKIGQACLGDLPEASIGNTPVGHYISFFYNHVDEFGESSLKKLRQCMAEELGNQYQPLPHSDAVGGMTIPLY